MPMNLILDLFDCWFVGCLAGFLCLAFVWLLAAGLLWWVFSVVLYLLCWGLC